MHKKIKFFKNELLNMIKLTQFIKKFNGSFGPPYSSLCSIIYNMQIVFTISNAHNRQKLYIFENCTYTITYTLITICNCLSAS